MKNLMALFNQFIELVMSILEQIGLGHLLEGFSFEF